MLLGFGGAKTDHIRDMITTSTNVAESIPRSRISKKEAAGQLRIRSKLNLVKNHQANVEQVLWFQNAYTIAEGGQGRREAVDMIIGQVAGMFRRRGNSLGRYRTMDRGEIQA
tara:strand:+ start:223 stop:558 length:336 start_codon:yes stop_codon:yes gene_type:complete